MCINRFCGQVKLNWFCTLSLFNFKRVKETDEIFDVPNEILSQEFQSTTLNKMAQFLCFF